MDEYCALFSDAKWKVFKFDLSEISSNAILQAPLQPYSIFRLGIEWSILAKSGALFGNHRRNVVDRTDCCISLFSGYL